MRNYRYLLVVAGLMLAGAGCYGSTSVQTDVSAPAPEPAPTAAQGRAVFTVTDAATALTGVTAVQVTVDKLEAHSATQGWVTVSTEPKTYDLLQLKATSSSALLADAQLAADTYDQVRLNISNVTLTANGKAQQVKLPSNTLKIVGSLTVSAGQTATASLDFMVDKSLHVTSDGKYILAPVVRLLTKTGATVQVGADDKVEVQDGKTESDETAGMDETGEMKSDFQLQGNLDLDAEGMVKINP